MHHALMGSTGLPVSRFSLGTWTFTESGSGPSSVATIDAAKAERLVADAIDRGITWFDTADRYGGGEAERVLGRALGARRQDVLITTKVGMRTGSAVTAAGLSRRHILASIDDSLRRLGTDWVDFYIAHLDDPRTPLEETLAALDTVVRAGKARHIGFSNWTAWRAAAAIQFQRSAGLAPFTHGQIHYSLLCRDAEHDLIPMARHFGIGLTIWSPLVTGFLSGKYKRGDAWAADSRLGQLDIVPFDRETGHRTVDALRLIAARHGATPAQIALAWLLDQPAVTSIIIGVSKPPQLADSLAAAGIALTPADHAELDAVTKPPLPYPLWHQRLIGDPVLEQALAGDRRQT